MLMCFLGCERAETMQDDDFKWFVENMPSLYERFGHCFLAIKDKDVIGRYGSYAEGVREASKISELGTFIVQECGENESAYTNVVT